MPSPGKKDQPMSFISRDTRFLGRDVLDNDALRSLAPSIFAADKHDSRSDRYAYIPTVEIVDGRKPSSRRHPSTARAQRSAASR